MSEHPTGRRHIRRTRRGCSLTLVVFIALAPALAVWLGVTAYQRWLEIRIIGSQTSETPQATEPLEITSTPTSRPARQQLEQFAFASSDGSVWLASIEDFHPRPVMLGRGETRALSWAPNGKKLAVVQSDNGLYASWLVNMVTQESLEIISAPEYAFHSWSPDNQHLRIGLWDEEAYRVSASYLVSTDTGEIAQLALTQNYYAIDGRRYVVVHMEHGGTSPLIGVITGETAEMLTEHRDDRSYYPLMVMGGSDRSEMFLVVQTGKEVMTDPCPGIRPSNWPLRDCEVYTWDPGTETWSYWLRFLSSECPRSIWFPNATSVVLLDRSTWCGLPGIYRIDGNGTRYTIVEGTDYDAGQIQRTGVGLSDDGQMLVFLEEESREGSGLFHTLYVVGIGGDNLRSIWTVGGDDTLNVVPEVYWIPNKHSVLLWTFDVIALGETSGALHIADLDSGQLTPLAGSLGSNTNINGISTVPEFSPNLSPTGDWVAFKGRQAGQYPRWYIARIDGTKLVRVAPDRFPQSVNCGQWSPTGSYLLCTCYEGISVDEDTAHTCIVDLTGHIVLQIPEPSPVSQFGEGAVAAWRPLPVSDHNQGLP